MPARQPHIDAVLRVLKAQKGRAISVQQIIDESNLSRTAVFGGVALLSVDQIITVKGKQNSIKAEVSLNSMR